MEPPRAGADPKPGLVQMLHTRPDRRKLLYMPCRNTQTLRSPPAHRRQRRRRHTSPEQLPQNLRQPALRKELPMAKPNRHSRKTPAILNRTRYPLGERRSRHDPATPAAARMTAMLRHFQRTRLRKVEYLTRYRRAHRSRSQQRRPAALAHRRNMGLHPVRGLNTAQRLALVARLTLRLPTRLATKAPRATLTNRLLQTVARRRLAAIAAVQTETALQITYPLPKPSVLQLKTRDLPNQRLGPRHPQWVKRLGTTHPKVDSFSNPRVNPLQLKHPGQLRQNMTFRMMSSRRRRFVHEL